MPPRSSKQLNIAMLGHKRIPSREGGVEIVVEELATRMVALGHTVTCYNRRGHHVSGKEFDDQRLSEYQGVRIKSVPTLQKGGLAAMSASFFAAICAAFGRYDVVHFHAEGPCAMLWLPKLFGKRCIATVHGLDHQRAKWGRLASAYIRAGEKCLARYADEVIVLSRNVQKYFLEQYGRETVYIPNGVLRPRPAEQEDPLFAFGLEKDEYILFLGRLVPEKGLRYLIEAFRGVETEKKLVIAGGSSDTSAFAEELKAMSAEDPRILYTGFVQGAALEALYRYAYLYVLPSDLEGMPLSLLEAMSYGNCCLTSDIPECVEVIRDHGVCFRKGDIADLQSQLQQLCADPARVAALKAEAADYICSRYNWDDVVAKTLHIYNKGTKE